MQAWTFFGVPFEPISSDRTLPRWQSQVKSDIKELLGTRTAEINMFGYGARRMTVEAHFATLVKLNDMAVILGFDNTLVTDEGAFPNVVLLEFERTEKVSGIYHARMLFVQGGSY